MHPPVAQIPFSIQSKLSLQEEKAVAKRARRRMDFVLESISMARR
jgi:hypothetical protein